MLYSVPLRWYTLLVPILLFVWITPLATHAQLLTGEPSTMERPPPQAQIVGQHADLLNTDNPHLQQQAMRNIIALSHSHPAAHDWSAVGRSLVRIYSHNTDDRLRIMAASAIYTIGDQHSIDAINRHNALVRHTHALQRSRYTPSRVEQIGDRAVRMYYHTRSEQRRADRIQRRIDRHMDKAHRHTQKATRLGQRMPTRTSG
ncbi:hypothetical protein [Longimonas halophila]|nr:hypothetical protein [Longimonas halophila]